MLVVTVIQLKSEAIIMYKLIMDMVYRYEDNGGLQLVGYLEGLTVAEFLAVHKEAFL